MVRITFHTQGIELDKSREEKIAEQVKRSLRRFSDNVHFVVVHIKDINGPRGGRDTSVVIRTRLHGRAELVASACRSELLAATSVACRRMRRQVKRSLRRQRSFERPPVEPMLESQAP